MLARIKHATQICIDGKKINVIFSIFPAPWMKLYICIVVLFVDAFINMMEKRIRRRLFFLCFFRTNSITCLCLQCLKYNWKMRKYVQCIYDDDKKKLNVF